jgi:hypothetical protein
MNELCNTLSCPVPNVAVQGYLNQYSLEGVILGNLPYTTVINGKTITIPGGTLSLPLPPVLDPAIIPAITYEGCSGPISLPVPPGSTPAQITAIGQQVLQLAAAQQAQCDAVAQGSPKKIYRNDQLTIPSACTPPNNLAVTGALFPGLSVSGNDFIVAAGIFTSTISITDANNIATAYAQNWIASLFASHGAVCGVVGPVLYYKLDEVNGTRFDVSTSYPLLEYDDSTGLPAPGTVGSRAGEIGLAVNIFNTDYLGSLVGFPASFQPPLSLSFWINVDGASGNHSNPMNVATNYGTFISVNHYPPSNQLSFTLDYGNAILNVTIPATGWHLIVLIDDLVANTWSVYLDGTFVASTAGAFTPSVGTALQLGSGGQHGNYGFDEMGFWDRLLTLAEITALYNGGAGLPYTPGTPPF